MRSSSVASAKIMADDMLGGLDRRAVGMRRACVEISLHAIAAVLRSPFRMDGCLWRSAGRCPTDGAAVALHPLDLALRFGGAGRPVRLAQFGGRIACVDAACVRGRHAA